MNYKQAAIEYIKAALELTSNDTIYIYKDGGLAVDCLANEQFLRDAGARVLTSIERTKVDPDGLLTVADLDNDAVVGMIAEYIREDVEENDYDLL